MYDRVDFMLRENLFKDGFVANVPFVKNNFFAGDFFDVFGVLYTESGFSVNPPAGDIVDVLAKYHNVDRSTIQIDGDISKIEAFFEIKISTSDRSITLTCVFGSGVTGVELSEDEIVF